MGETLAFSHRPQSRWRRVGIALIVVPAALIALLAVHFFLAESQVPKPHAVSSSTVGTHGSSENRQQWFTAGLNGGTNACNTFEVATP